jgi:hypothetical protein
MYPAAQDWNHGIMQAGSAVKIYGGKSGTGPAASIPGGNFLP